MNLAEFQDWFNPLFAAYVADQCSVATQFFDYPEVWQHVQHFLAGGKRIRPFLVHLMYTSAGGKHQDELLPYLFAIELFHSFALVHDDIIDQSPFRHNVPTVHAFLETLYSKAKRIGDAKHTSMSQAILVGDLLFSWSIHSFSQG